MESPRFLELNSHEVHIWSASLLEGKNNADYFYSILSEDECGRANSFIFPKDQRRFIITRGILRNLLSNYLGQMPESIEIIYGFGENPVYQKINPYTLMSHIQEIMLCMLCHVVMRLVLI